MRILFITATRLGDAVLSTGLLNHLLRAYPQAQFTVACGPVAQGVFARMPRLERLIVVDKKRYDLHWLTLWAACAATAWDMTVDLRGSGLSLFLRSGRRAIMRGGRRPGHRLTHTGRYAGHHAAAVARRLDHGRRPSRGRTPSPPRPPHHRPGPHRELGRQDLARRALRRPVRSVGHNHPGARAAVFGGPGPTERQAAAAVLAALAERGGPGRPAHAAPGRRLPGPLHPVRRQRFRPDAPGRQPPAPPTIGLFGPTPASEYAPSGRHPRRFRPGRWPARSTPRCRTSPMHTALHGAEAGAGRRRAAMPAA